MNQTQALKIIEQNKDSYNQIAQEFSQSRTRLWPEIYDFKKQMQIHGSPRVLDLGCGNGRLLELFKGTGIEYHGLDISRKLLGIAFGKAQELKIKAEFKTGDVLDLPYAENQFDYIFCLAVLNHIPSKELQIKALKEMRRVLLPAGALFMTNWNLWRLSINSKKNAWRHGLKKDIIPAFGKSKAPLYYRAFTIKELNNLCKQAGFTVKESYYVKDGKRARWYSANNIVTIA